MSDYINHKEYKLPNGRTVTADFNELGHATVTIQAMDALFDILNSSDVVEVVRCKDCKHWINQKDGVVEVPICARRVRGDKSQYPCIMLVGADDFCSYGERADK